MRRMAIFVFYDFEGIVDEYVKYLLQSLMTVAEKIVIVSNGKLDIKGRKEFEIFTKYVYERDNRGYDAGAYKDTFTVYLKNEEWEKWDEVIMLNDTFYGPIYPWQEVFEKMDRQNVDFWGMTKQEKYKWYDGTILPPHIQSYFLAVRKKILVSDTFKEFWINMDYSEELLDAVLNFEVRFTNYFSKHNYKYITYVDVMRSDFLIDKTELPYEYYIMELLTITRMPLVKRKALTILNFEKALKTFQCMSQYTEYDIELIKKHMERLDINQKISPFGYLEVNSFCERFPVVSIYGHGKIGKQVGAYLRWRGLKFEKYIVPEKKESDGDSVVSYRELVIDNETGIIIALGRMNTAEVLPEITKEIPREQLLIPRYA